VPTVHAYRLALYIKIIVVYPEESRIYIQREKRYFSVKCGGTYRSHWAEKCWRQEIQNDSNSKWLSSWGFNLCFQITSTSLWRKPVIPSNVNCFVSVRNILPICAA